MNTAEENTAPERPGVVRVKPLTTVALNQEIVPMTLLQWLAGYGLAGPVGYETSAELILRVIPRGFAAGPEVRLAQALAKTFCWLAEPAQGARPPTGYTDTVLWEACALAQNLPASRELTEALLKFCEVARHREPPLPEAVRRELTEALRVHQPADLQRRENRPAQYEWQGHWLGMLTGRDTFLVCLRDDAVLSLMEATFGKKKSEPLRSMVASIREAADEAYGESRQKSDGRYLSAASAQGGQLLSQMAGEQMKCVAA